MQQQATLWSNRSVHRTRCACVLAAAVASLSLPVPAHGLTIAVAFRTSTYQVVAGDTYADLLAEHQTGALLGAASVTALSSISTSIYAPGVTTNYSMLMRILLDVAVSGLYEFQVGVDWGRGGVAAVVDNSNAQVTSEYVRTDDLWWANNWSNPDVFSTQVTLNQGESYTLDWIGFEGCCAGASTIRFSFNGGTYQPLDDTNLAPYAVPEPGSLVLLALGLCSLTARRTARA